MSVTITKTWRVNGVLTDVTSMILQDPTEAYGVKRNDNDAVVVASGTAMTWVSTGTYSYIFAEPAYSLEYSVSVKVTYLGNTYYLTDEDLAGNDPAPTSTGLSTTYAVLCQEIAHFVGWRRGPTWSAERTATLDAIIRSGLNKFYYPTLGKTETYQWSFLRPLSTMQTTAPYATGTVTIANGVVTLSGGVFPSWAAQGELVVNSETYPVSTRDSDTQLTLTNDWVDVSTASVFSLGRPAYDLPVDFTGRLASEITFRPGVNEAYPPIRITEPGALQSKQQGNPYSGVPYLAAVRPKAFVATTGQRWQLILYPTPDDAYELFYRYKVKPGMLDSTNIYPLGGDQHGETILESCLAIAEQRLMDGGDGIHAAAFAERLAASIAEDRDSFTPDTIGDDEGGQEDSSVRRYSTIPITFNGVDM